MMRVCGALADVARVALEVHAASQLHPGAAATRYATGQQSLPQRTAYRATLGAPRRSNRVLITRLNSQ